MNNTESQEKDQPKRTPGDSFTIGTNEFSDPIHVLLQSNSIQDPVDKEVILAALAFSENPTDDVREIQDHSCAIAMVLMQYPEIDLQPAEIRTLHYKLYQLESQYYIRSIESQIGKEVPDFSKIETFIIGALNSTGILAKYANDNTLQIRVSELQQRVALLKG